MTINVKFFLFSDLHANNKALDNIISEVTKIKPDAILFAGDFVNMGEPVWFGEKAIEKFKSLKIPFLWIPGNNDFGRSYYKIQSTIKSVEGRVAEIVKEQIPGQARDDKPEVCRITGVGGSPASWAGQYQGENKKHQIKIGGTFFISHVPPPGVHNWSKEDLHSPADQRKKLTDSPKVHICGHVHHQWGTAYLGSTKIVKLASAEHGRAAIIDTEDLSVEFITVGNKSVLND